MILSSLNELADRLDQAINDGDEAEINLLSWKATWAENGCFHCGLSFEADDRPFFWMGHGQGLAMHQKCFLDWLTRLRQDVDRISAELVSGAGVRRG